MGRVFLHILFVVAGVFSSAAYGTVQIVTVSGASNFSLGDGTTSTTTTMYGGLAGKCASPGATLCNSCVGHATTEACPIDATKNYPLCSCNTGMVQDAAPVSITFTSNIAGTGSTVARLGSSTTIFGSAVGYAGPGTVVVNTTWGEICGNLFSTAGTCTGTSGSQQLRVGITGDNVSFADVGGITVTMLTAAADQIDDCTATTGGICHFWSYPGDESVYMKDLTPAGALSSPQSLRVFISDQNFNKANPTDAIQTTDLQLNADGSLPNTLITGLNNDPPVPYHFRVAVVDLAGNVSNFTSDANITAATGGACTVDAQNADLDSTDGCKYHATPDQVLGLLSKDLACFVATAAYGSPMAPKLNTFREFRSRYLLINPWGRRFVDSYYKWGPKAAHFIDQHEWARSAARALLWPAYGFAFLSLQMGFLKASLVVAMGVILLVGGLSALASLTRKTAE
jgi:hypothetical protein